MTMKASLAVMSLLFGLAASDVGAQVQQRQAPLRPPQPSGQDRAVMLPPPGAVQLGCRGGAMPGFEFHQWSASVSKISVRFNKGARPARQGLNPGECSWMDRAMSPSDPAAFCQDVADGVIIVNYREDQSYRPPQFYVMQTFWSRTAPYIEHIQQPNYQFTLNVKPEGSCLTVVTP
jgi:hypothetical protein